MTVPLLFCLASAAALAVLGLADPKRRRSRGEGPAPRGWRPAALGALALSGVGLLASAGPAGGLVWAAAVAAAGWGLTNGLAAAPDGALAGLSAVFAGWAAPGAAGGRGLRMPRLPAALPPVALACLLVAVAAWRGAPPDGEPTQRLAALALLDRIDRGAAARRADAPCLAAFAALRGPEGLRDVLSDRPATLALPARGDAGGDLQRCILAVGGEGAAVERDGDADLYALDADTAARVHAAAQNLLLDDDALAALLPGDGVGAGLLCRRVAEAVGPDVPGALDALRRDRAYSKADDLLLRLPDLDRLARARRAGAPCPD